MSAGAGGSGGGEGVQSIRGGGGAGGSGVARGAEERKILLVGAIPASTVVAEEDFGKARDGLPGSAVPGFRDSASKTGEIVELSRTRAAEDAAPPMSTFESCQAQLPHQQRWMGENTPHRSR